ncbi:MAG TPA: hypothetical protein VL357_05945 [Rariglobus sp.]|nr:hypothetical protein [Rariglobus sp.]
MPAEGPVQFSDRRKARRIIARTERVVARVRSSLLSDWDKLKSIGAALPLEIKPVYASS